MEISINKQCIGCGTCTKICPSHIFVFPKEECVKKTQEEETKTAENTEGAGSAESTEGVKSVESAENLDSSENWNESAPQRFTEPEVRTRKPQLIHADACFSCGHCVCACPADAIVHSEFPKEKLISLENAPEPDWKAFQSLVSMRRSVRSFRKESLTHEILVQILQAAEMAPTACNLRHVHWTVVTNLGTLTQVRMETVRYLQKVTQILDSRWAKWVARLLPFTKIGKNMKRLPLLQSLAALAETEDVILYNAPALLIAHYESSEGRFAEIDAQLALQNATLAVNALGLGTFYTGFVLQAAESNQEISKILHIPSNHRIAGGMTVGIPAVKYRYIPKRNYPVVQYLD